MAGSRRVVVVGASAAGLRCACRLARLRPTWRITVVEQREAFSYSACGLPYVLAGDVGEPDALRSTADGTLRDAHYFDSLKGVEVRGGVRAEAIEVEGRTLLTVDRNGGRERLPWDELVLATGARARRLPAQVDHPRVRTLHTVDDLLPLRQGLVDGTIAHVVVIGAGFLGCELSEAFTQLWGAHVTLVEAAPHPLPTILDEAPARVVETALLDAGVTLHCGTPVDRLAADDRGVTVTAGDAEIRADVAVVAVGVEPVVEPAASAGVALGESGAIAVDDRLATSVGGIWAVGDCCEVQHAITGGPAWLPLGSLANRQGRTLADVLAGRDVHFPAVAGAVAVKVFDCNVAAVGCTVAEAARRGIETHTAWITAHDRPHWWPEAAELAIQLVYAPASRWVLGLQVVGPGDAARRVDVAAPLLARGATLADLAAVEHAYAPPYAPALDPLAVAAMVAENQEEGLAAVSPVTALDAATVLDVRNPGERRARPIDGACAGSIPLEQVRRGNPVTRPDLAVCERGPRAAEAARRLGIPYLGGGLRWRDGLRRGRE